MLSSRIRYYPLWHTRWYCLIVTDDRQVVFADQYLWSGKSMASFFQPVASDGVHRIRRIDDQSAVVQDVGYPLQVLRVIVLSYSFKAYSLLLFLFGFFFKKSNAFSVAFSVTFCLMESLLAVVAESSPSFSPSLLIASSATDSSAWLAILLYRHWLSGSEWTSDLQIERH